MGQLLLFFLCNFSSLFSYVGGIPVTNHVSLFIDLQVIFWLFSKLKYIRSICDTLLICRDLMNFLRSLDTMVITIESDQKSLKVIFTEQFLAKVAIFCCFDACSVPPPQIFQVQAKTETVRPVFPDYLSISYDYDLI